MSPKAPEPARSADLTKPLTDWIRRHITPHNVLMALVLLFQGGQYWEKQQQTNQDLTRAVAAFEVRLQAQELALKADDSTNAQTYARRDVIEALLRAIDTRLTTIEGLMRGRRD
jgi:hypothetical protein